MKQLLLSGFLLCFSIALFAQNGPRISVQGTLKTVKDVTVDDGTYELTFRLYAEEEGGTAVFEEVANVEVIGGIYTYKLGSINTLDPSMFGVTLYLGITVNGVEIKPRGELTYAPYALAVNTAINADTADYVRFGMIGGESCSGRIGDVKYSVLPLAQFQTQNGDCWRLMDGTTLPVGNALRGLTSWTEVPDARGVFLRSHDDRTTASNEREDPDRDENTAIGTSQQDAIQSHRHLGINRRLFESVNPEIRGFLNTSGSVSISVYPADPHDDSGLIKTSADNARASTETRPKNINLYLYIRVE